MTQLIAVTTFSKSGYEKYAKTMLESVLARWPSKIVVYVESPIDLKHDNLEIRDFFGIGGAMNFYQNIKKVPICHGRVGDGYNYNYDIWRFSRKMFAQWDVLKTHRGKVFWIDADCFIRKVIPEQWLTDLFDGKGLSYLGREGVYTETGLVGFDTENEKFKDFLHFYIGFLRHGWFKDHERWHDCAAFDFAREKSGISGNNLSPFFKIPDGKKMTLETMDVFRKSILEEYIAHFKGGRKDILTNAPKQNFQS